MPLHLPTDTGHIRPPTRQFELFGRQLGAGIDRRRLIVGGLFAVLWIALLAGVFGVSPLGRLGPMLYILPPAFLAIVGTRIGDDGRMSLMRVYDRLLARRARRRAPRRNPCLPASARTPAPMRLTVHARLGAERPRKETRSR